MPAFGGNPNHSLTNPFKPGQPGVGMQPHNQRNALIGRMQPQVNRPFGRNPFMRAPGQPVMPFGAQGPGQFGQGTGPPSLFNFFSKPYMQTINEMLGGMVPPVMPYVRPPNIDLYGGILGEYRDLTDTSLPLLDALLGQELSMEALIKSQDHGLLQQLLEKTAQMPSPRPRSGTSFFRGFSG